MSIVGHSDIGKRSSSSISAGLLTNIAFYSSRRMLAKLVSFKYKLVGIAIITS